MVLGAENRKEMEDWCQALKAAAAREFYDPTPPDQHDFLSGYHHWYATSHARPTYCNVSIVDKRFFNLKNLKFLFQMKPLPSELSPSRSYIKKIQLKISL